MFEVLHQWLHTYTHPEKPVRTGCACCGKCCLYFGGHLHASDHDIARWQHEGRDDLLARVNRLGWIWVDPETKQLVAPCPFLQQLDEQRWGCSIYETRPAICKDYPTLAHGHRCLSGVFLKM